MKNKTTYYRHTYTVIVLSESETPDALENLARNVNVGPDCLHSFDGGTEKLNGRDAAKLLIEAGSEPALFQLDDSGEKLNESRKQL